MEDRLDDISTLGASFCIMVSTGWWQEEKRQQIKDWQLTSNVLLQPSANYINSMFIRTKHKGTASESEWLWTQHAWWSVTGLSRVSSRMVRKRRLQCSCMEENVDVRAERTMDRLVGEPRKALESQITTGDKGGMQNTVSGCTTRPTVGSCVCT